jgi:hypothetical protein
MRLVGLGLTIAMALPLGGGHWAKQVTVPFVGCPADGQGGYIAPPQGVPKTVTLPDVPAEALAYYKGEEASGVYAPRGWHCQVTYGSSGSAILVTLETIDSTKLFSSLKVYGPAVELVFQDGGTSGRFPVATYAARLFPMVAARFIDGVRKEGLVPASELTLNDPADSVTLLGSLVAEFMTPAEKSGIGTGAYLGPSHDAIRGIASLDNSDPTEPGLWILRARLGPNKNQVETAILRLNKACMGSNGGC